MTDKCKAELLRVLKKKHGVKLDFSFLPCGAGEPTYEINDNGVDVQYGPSIPMGEITYTRFNGKTYDFDHAVVTDAVHVWLMGLDGRDIDFWNDGVYIHLYCSKEGAIGAIFNYPLSVAIWNVTEFVLKEMGDV